MLSLEIGHIARGEGSGPRRLFEACLQREMDATSASLSVGRSRFEYDQDCSGGVLLPIRRDDKFDGER
jgi:hypothetical protein